MQHLLKTFISTAKAIALVDAEKARKARYIQSAFDNAGENSIMRQRNLIDLIKVDFEKIDMASAQLEKARTHLVGALAALDGFDDISKRELLLAANFTNGYIYMLGEFIRQKQIQTPKPVAGLLNLKGWRGNA
jgi:hypothetical protein